MIIFKTFVVTALEDFILWHILSSNINGGFNVILDNIVYCNLALFRVPTRHLHTLLNI